MKGLMVSVFALFCCVSPFAVNGEEVRDPTTGETFSPDVTVDHEGKTFHLQATGVATRKKLIVSVYSVAHYLQEGAFKAGDDPVEVIMKDTNAKQLTLKWVHEVSAEKVQNGYKESLKNALSEADLERLQKDVDQYVAFFSQDVKKGDEHVIRWLPGGYVEVILNGKKAGSLTDPAFAAGLWSIWFGEKSVVNRTKLISLLK